uniref:Uncharacterized protein n=1 Tax=Callorhinchus milii TaxID=7868 RepID=A0A4W3H546_CALMI
MSAQTTSRNAQDIIESRVEKRTKGVYVPYAGKKLITFMDDLNMPAKDLFGSQPPLELIRLWIDYGFWYDRLKQSVKYIKVKQSPCSSGVRALTSQARGPGFDSLPGQVRSKHWAGFLTPRTHTHTTHISHTTRTTRRTHATVYPAVSRNPLVSRLA